MYEQREGNARFTNSVGSSWTETDNSDGFWGAKLDRNITDNHLIELLAFNDETETLADAYAYSWANAEKTGYTGSSTVQTGGDSGSITYTGHFGENFTAKAMYGINQSRALSFSPADGLCSQVLIDNASYGAAYRAMGSPPVRTTCLAGYFSTSARISVTSICRPSGFHEA